MQIEFTERASHDQGPGLTAGPCIVFHAPGVAGDTKSEPPKQHENDNDDQDGADETDTPVTEAVTVAAELAAEAAEQDDDKDDNEDGSE
jgi:hypothetical protein